MKEFLSTLFFEKFKNNEREKRLMDNNTWEDSESGRNACIRNDQSISEVRKTGQILDRLIDRCLEGMGKI